MILYSPPYGLYCPSGCGGETIQLPTQGDATDMYVLVRHPFDRIRTLYEESDSMQDLKDWLRASPPNRINLSPGKTIRIEDAYRELQAHWGVKVKTLILPTPTVHLCASAATYIKRVYCKELALYS